jgi:hypothetical protein
MDIFTTQSIATHTFGMNPENTIPYSVVLIFYFLFTVSMARSGIIQTAGVGLIGSFFTFFGLVVVLPIWISFPIVVLVFLALIAPIVLALCFELKARRVKEKVIKALPLASAGDVSEVVDLIMFKAAKLPEFRLHDDGMVVYGDPKAPMYVNKSSPLKYLNRPYVYAAQAAELNSRYPHALLGKDDLHRLCAHLYFNWAIDAMNLDNQAISVTLLRRGETKVLQFIPADNEIKASTTSDIHTESAHLETR